MYGAIFGDMAGGSPRGERGSAGTDVPLLHEKSSFTGDTVRTVAVAEALLRAGYDADGPRIRKSVASAVKSWDARYPDAGPGNGSGSAACVSPAGWLYPTIARTREVARWTADACRSRPDDGPNGAEAVASVIFFARNGSGKAAIRRYLTGEFSYDLTGTADEIRSGRRREETGGSAVREAVLCFLEAESCEEAVRLAVSRDGGADGSAALAGSMAEAFYGVREEHRKACEDRLDGDILPVLGAFWDTVEKIDAVEGQSCENPEAIRKAIRYFHQNTSHRTLEKLLQVILGVMNHDGEVLVPARTEAVLPKLGTCSPADPALALLQTIERKDRTSWLVAFTREEEMEKGQRSPYGRMPLRTLIQTTFLMTNIQGVVLDPWDRGFFLDKNLAGPLFSRPEGETGKNQGKVIEELDVRDHSGEKEEPDRTDAGAGPPARPDRGADGGGLPS